MPKKRKAVGAEAVDLPPRVAMRPDPALWSGVELMMLEEAAALFWPCGPLTTTSLRTAVRDGKLEIVEIAGKILTNKDSIAKMSVCGVRAPSPAAAPAEMPPVETASSGMPRSVAEYRRMVAEGKL